LQARGKTEEEVIALLDEGVYDMEKLKAQGWVTDLKYSDELEDELKGCTGGKDDEAALVPLTRYQNGVAPCGARVSL
jgi:protease IV